MRTFWNAWGVGRDSAGSKQRARWASGGRHVDQGQHCVGTASRLLMNLVSFLLSAWGLKMFLRKGMIRLVLEIYCGLQMVAGPDGVVEGAHRSLAVS